MKTLYYVHLPDGSEFGFFPTYNNALAFAWFSGATADNIRAIEIQE